MIPRSEETRQQLLASCSTSDDPEECGRRFPKIGGGVIKTAAAFVTEAITYKFTQPHLDELVKFQITKGNASFEIKSVTSASVQASQGSKCGNIVNLATPKGNLVIDENDVYANDRLVQNMVNEGLLPAATAADPGSALLLKGFSFMGTFNPEIN